MQFYLRAEYFESLELNLATECRSFGEVTRQTTFSVK